MLDAGLRNHLFDIERLTLPGIELADPDFDFSSPPAKSVQAFEELTAEQLPAPPAEARQPSPLRLQASSP
jgi:hypothetical protein